MSKMRVEFITKKQLTVEFVKISNHNVSRILVGNSVSRNHLRGKAKNLGPKIQVQKIWVQKIQVQKMNLRGKAKTAKSLIFMFSTKVYAPQKSAMLPVRRLLLD